MASATLDLSALLRASTIEDHEAVLKACNAKIKQSKSDFKAQHVKIVALLKLERYDEALRALDAGGEPFKQIALFERAYALYKTGSFEEAKGIAGSIKNDRGARHLEAQASYRSEQFPDAAEVYQQLASTHVARSMEGNDLRINSSATDAQLEWKAQGHLAQKRKPTREDLEVFETAYNAACASIARDELGQSEVLLRRAKDLCRALDELTDQQKLEELLPISLQQLYVLSRLGKYEEAERLASEISMSNVNDHSTQQVGQNNILAAAASPSNPFLAHRFIHKDRGNPKTAQLYSYQSDLINQNCLALDLSIGKSPAVAKFTQRGITTQPCGVSRNLCNLSALNAAAHAQNELGKLGLKKIAPLMEKRPTDIGLALTIVQLYILSNNHGSALKVMESLLERLSLSSDPTEQDARFAPGLVIIIISLYRRQNRKSQITSLLAKAASYWRHKQKRPNLLLQAAGLVLSESAKQGDQELAQQIFLMLHDTEPSSRFATAGYVATNAALSPENVSAHSNTLSPTQRLIAGLDVSSLESAGVPLPPNADASMAKHKRALDEKPEPKKKRIRKSRLPKDYDPNKVPDPERWLPLRDRSTYKPKGKKGKKKAEALTQGGVGDGPKDTTKGGAEEVLHAKGGGGGAKKKKGKK